MSSKVKQFVLWLVVLLVWAAPAGALETNLMTHVDGEYLYVIKFVYSTNTYITPAAYSPHYDAEITVMEVRSNAVVEVCPPWRGYYTVRKCYEDEPAAVVRQALSRRWRRRMAHADPEPPLTPAVLRALGFIAVGRGRNRHWLRRAQGSELTLVWQPTASQLFYQMEMVAVSKARCLWRAAIKAALNLDEHVLSY